MIQLLVFFQALSCLLNPPTPFVTEWGHNTGKWFGPEQWTALQQVEGRDLWLGYENGGWFTTGDERGAYKMIGEGYEIWVFYSPSRHEYDLLPFANTEIFADANGDHLGMHPCGGWAVERERIMRLLNHGDGGKR